MRYKNRPVTEFMESGFNPVHLFGDYYLLRKYSISYKRYSTYRLAKIHDTIPPIEPCVCGGEAKLGKCGDHKEFYIVRCRRCFAYAGGIDNGASVNPAEAVRRWNKSVREEKKAVSE